MSEPITHLKFSAPIRIVSEANNRQHWSKKNERKKSQQIEINVEMSNAIKRRTIALPCVITLCRVGPKYIDDDNLANAFKGCRDHSAGHFARGPINTNGIEERVGGLEAWHQWCLSSHQPKAHRTLR